MFFIKKSTMIAIVLANALTMNASQNNEFINWKNGLMAASAMHAINNTSVKATFTHNHNNKSYNWNRTYTLPRGSILQLVLAWHIGSTIDAYLAKKK